jgi:hypothetical protein
VTGEGPKPDEIDLALFEENRTKFPPEDLLCYAGQYIAWSPDGTRVVASAPDRAALRERLKTAGVPANRVVFNYVDPPDVAFLG